MRILEVKIDNLTRPEIIEKINIFLTEGGFHQVATVNPEFILMAQKDEGFKNILNQCDLNVADGTGIKFAFWRFGKKLKTRFAGADLMMEILRLANEKKLSVFLAANDAGLSKWEETRDAIVKIYPEIKINGENLNKKSADYPAINKQRTVVFCNFGAPFQEKFLHSLKAGDCGKIKLAMGVGGSFDFLTGKLRRAPVWMRKIGMEWLFRLIQQPSRFRRIFKAVAVFPVKIILKK